MQLFYDPTIQVGSHVLNEEEARHAFRVLRKRTGDILDLVDGRGGWYQGTVTEISKRNCLLEVTMVRQETQRAGFNLTLLVAPTKQIDRFEWILEKATELGIDQIQPFLSEHSERKTIRPDRLERVIVAAMKQSLRGWKPQLHPLRSFRELIEQPPPATEHYLAYLGADHTPHLHHALNPGQHLAIAIGPEGGFSPDEAIKAHAAGYTYVSLGPNRLRTETAAIAATHTANQANWT